MTAMGDAPPRGTKLAASRPSLIEFHTDPAIPPIPPHATSDQLVKATESVARGDSDRVDVIKEGVKSKMQGCCLAAEISDHLWASQVLETIKKGQPDLAEP
jgi:hypothetical protein